jgi:MoaA/NifB/PqqE/SkfB family radical SAM enzyme
LIEYHAFQLEEETAALMFEIQQLVKVGKALALQKFFGKSTPLSVTFMTTHHCNFSCDTCDIKSYPGRDIEAERFINLIDEVADAGAIRVSFTGGGEPLMRRDMGELISHAKKRGLIVSLVTNGFLIDRKLSELKELDLLLVSYDRSKKLPGNPNPPLEKILENALLARRNGIPVVLQSILTRDTCLNLDFFFDISHRYGFVFSVQPLASWYQGGIIPNHQMPSVEEMGAAIDWVLREKKQHNNILNSVKYLKTVKKYWLQPNKKGNCTAGLLYATITADGIIFPCNPFIANGENKISALDQPFRQAFRRLTSCQGCLWNCHMELNNMFTLDPGTLVNLIRFSRNRIVYRKGQSQPDGPNV